MKKAFFLVPIALLFLAVSCPQNPPIPPRPDELPSITQSGENTFGCLLNGKVWLPGGGGLPAFNPQYYKSKFSVGTDKLIENHNNQLIIWSIYPVTDTGKYYIKNGPDYLGASFVDHVSNSEYKVRDNDSLNNWVHITKFDQGNLIISGTFNLFFTEPGKDTIRITKGRFDAKYTY